MKPTMPFVSRVCCVDVAMRRDGRVNGMNRVTLRLSDVFGGSRSNPLYKQVLPPFKPHHALQLQRLE